MKYLVYIVFSIIVLRYVFFVILLLPIRCYMKLRKRTDKNKVQNLKNSKSIIPIRLIVRYIDGYVRYTIFKVGMLPSHRIRNFLYKNIYCVKMSPKSIVYFGAEIRAPYNLTIGNGSIIGDNAILDARNGIEIGENVNFSSKVAIWTEQHDHRSPLFEYISDESFKVKIENRVWLGPNVTILHGVTVGKGAVVAAGAVVTKDVEKFTIVAGIPAKKIGDRNQNLEYIFDNPPIPFY